MTARVPLLVVAAALVFVASACKCGKPTGPVAAKTASVTQKLPKAVEAAIVIPDLAALGEKLKLAQELKTASFLAQLQGFGSGPELASSFMSALGVDLRSREELAKIGIDPGKGAGVALLQNDEAYSVVAVQDEAKLKEFLKNLAKNRFGAPLESTWDEGGRKVITWARGGATPVLGYTVKDGFAFIAPNASKEKLRAWSELAEEQSLAKDPALDASLGRLPSTRDFVVHAPLTSTLARRGTLAGGTAVGTLSADAFTLNVDLPWPNNKESLEVLAAAGSADLLQRLPKDAFAVLQFTGDPAKLAPFWPHLVGPYVQKAFTASAMDVNGQILGNLKPGAAASLSVASTIRFDQRPEFDVRRTNPFRYVHLVALAEPKDAAAAKVTLEKLPEVAPKFGAKMAKEARSGHDVLVTSYAQGEGVHLALVKDTLVAASPLTRMDEAVAQVASGEKGPGPFSAPAFASFFEKRSLAALVDLHRLADSIRNLPGDAWGPGGSFVKAGWMRWLDGMDDLRAITAALSAREGAIQAELTLRFQKK